MVPWSRIEESLKDIKTKTEVLDKQMSHVQRLIIQMLALICVGIFSDWEGRP